MRIVQHSIFQLRVVFKFSKFLYSGQASFKTFEMPERKPFQRLPTNVKPVNYAVRIQPDLGKFTFEGSEEISVSVKEPTKEIVINSLDLDVSKVAFVKDGNKTAGEAKLNKEDETLRITFPSSLQTGDGVLSMSFCGTLKDDLKGFYRSKYEEKGETRYAAVTQFEPTDARRAFPCWDEPALKATFDMTLVVPKNRVALSNMPVKSEQPYESNGDLKVVAYERTPVMSTYLLAFVVGEYDYVEGKDTNGILHRVYTPLGKKEQGKFALEVSVKTLPFYTKFFTVAFPLPKIDLIAIPDFGAGAMENWGLVTYRENALLVDPQNSSQKNKLRVALVVGHELAHMWFGNLVTMEWWTHLWLNEGFASWIEYLCVDYCFPEFDVWTQFLTSDYARALVDDALENSHPIEVPVGHPSEIDEIFDAVSYSKGASVIRMLHNFIGDENFRKGLSLYLKKHKHGNTFTEDLWNSLEEASSKPIGAIMSTWTSKMGFPLISVTEKQNGNDRVLHITQRKFCAGGQKESSSKWKVPISVSTSKSPEKAAVTTLLESTSSDITVNNVKPEEWLKLNPGCVDFYRVHYSSAMLDRLVPAISAGDLSARDRLGLQNDLFALSMAGDMSADEVLKVVEAFANETNYTVWTDICANLAGISNIVQYTDFYDNYSAYIRRLFTKINSKLGWDEKPNESPLDSMLRGTVLAKMGYHGDEAVITEARRRFEAHYSGKEPLPSNLRSAVYVTVMAHGDESVFNKLVELHGKSELQEEISRIEMALGAGKTANLITKALDFSLSGKVRNQDFIYIIVGTTRTPKGHELTWKFVKDNWATLDEKFSGGFILRRLIKYATESFVTEDRADEIEKFFAEHPAPSAERSIQQSIESIRLNKNWLQRDETALRKFLG